MRNTTPNYNTNSSLFSLDYKIPYEDKQTTQEIADHLEESQSQWQFLKLKLTDAYEKLELQIRTNSHLQDKVAQMRNQFEQLSATINLQRNQNSKLKQVLEKILQNRKMTEKELQTVNQQCNKKIKAKNEQIQKLKQQHEKAIEYLKQKHHKEIQKLRVDFQKQVENHIQQKSIKHEQQIEILENEIEKITNEKVAQIKRLRHEIQCYKKPSRDLFESKIVTQSANNLIMGKSNAESKDPEKTKRRRQFKNQKNQYSMSSTGHQSSIHNLADITNQNVNSINKALFTQEQSIGKWKKKSDISSRITSKSVIQRPLDGSINNKNQRNVTPTKDLKMDDQLLSQYQLKRKQLQNQLVKLQRIKRPLPSDRVQMEALQKELYGLDSDIVGLKRKIRSRY